MVIKRSQLQELLRGLVKNVLTELGSMGASVQLLNDPVGIDSTLAAADATNTPTASAKASDIAKAERDQRKSTQLKLRDTQKSEKLAKDKHKAEDKQFRLNKIAFRKAESDLKRSI